MILNKGLHTDNNQLDQPDGTWFDAKNAIFDESTNFLSNENGFEKYSLVIPANKTIIGGLKIEQRLLVFIHDDSGNNDEIGYIESNGVYNSLKISTRLKFNIDFPIKAKRLNENFIAFTDYYNNLRYLNLKNPENSDNINYNLIAPEDSSSSFNFSVGYSEGGSFPEGSYSVYCSFVTKDGVNTNYFNSHESRILLSALGTKNLSSDNSSYSTQANENTKTSNKSLSIGFSAVNSNIYEFIDVVIIGYINNEVIAKKIRILSDETFAYFSKFEGDIIEIEEIFINKKNLVINDIDLNTNDFFGQGVREDDEINFQKYANNIRVSIDTAKIDVDNVKGLNGNGGSDKSYNQSLMPGEVYALYISLVYNDGRVGRAFHIPGRAPVAGETSASTISGLTNYKKYQISDTSYEPTTPYVTKCGYWENEDEVYPDLDDYDSTSLGGLNLRGEKVRHHKVPTFRRAQERNQSSPWNGNIYNTDVEVGRNALIRMRFQLSNVVIPSSISNKISGYNIYRAKRNIENSLVLGFAPVLFGGKMANPSVKLENNFVSICSNLNQRSAGGVDEQVVPDVKKLKFPCLDLLLNKPKINPVFVNSERVHVLDIDSAFPADNVRSFLSRSGNLKTVLTANIRQRFTLHSHISSSTLSLPVNSFGSEVIKPIKKYKYIPENSIFPEVFNKYGEETLLLEGSNDFDPLLTIGGGSINFNELYSETYEERSGICSLRQVPKNPYSLFYKQNNLVSMGFKGTSFSGGTYSEIYSSGDVLLGIDSIIHTAGAQGNIYETSTNPETIGSAKGLGSMSVRIYPTYSVNFPMLRREDASLDNGLIYMHTLDSKSILENYDPTKQVIRDINSSFTFENEVNSVIPYNPFEQFSTYHPNRIIRFTAIDRELKEKLTLSYLPNSYFELTDEKGKCKAINKINENLFIQCENGCYITRGKQSLQLDDVTAYIGNNDIFEIEPKLVLDSEGNYFGSQSKFTTLITNYGAIIVDQIQGKVFLYNGNTPQEISNLGMFNFFKDNLPFLQENYVIKSYNTLTVVSYNGVKMLITLTKTDNLTKYAFENNDIIYIINFLNYCRIEDVLEDSTKIYIYTDYNYTNTTPLNANLVHYSKSDSPFNNNGILTAYDFRNKRFLLTKKNENSLIPSLRYKGIYSSDTSYLASLEIEDVYRHGANILRKAGPVNNGNSLLAGSLVDNSYTISFNLEKGFWVSFHDYIPKIYLNNNDNLFSIYDNIIWNHNPSVSVKCNFYDTVYDFEIDLIFNANSIVSKKFKEIFWIIPFSQNKNYDNTKTFDSIELNSMEEESGIIPNVINLVNYVNINNQGNVRLLNGTWHFNKIRDTNNKVIFSKFLRIKLKTNKNYNLFIYEINCKFNYAKN